MVIFLDCFIIFKTTFKRGLLFIGFIFLFVGLEWFSDFFRVLIHVHWRIWWSFSFWLLTLLVLLGFMKFFRKILYKGGLKP
jgi:hypothetical protein